MAQFWKASSVTVNNGSKIVTVNTGDDVANIITNSMLQISNFQYVEVKTVNTVNQTIELFFPWDKGNVSAQPAIAAPNRAAIKEAVAELRALRQTYEALASDVSVAASANSIPRRDGSGRVKTGSPSANDDAVNKGYLGDVATRDVISNSVDITVGKVITNVANFNFFALRDAGAYYPSTANRNIDTLPVGDIALYATGNPGTFPSNRNIGFYHIQTRKNYTGPARTQFATGYFGTNASNDVPVYSMRTMDNSGEGWTPWANFLHDKNTNLNQFGGAGAHSVIATGVGRTNSEILFYLPINSFTEPTGISVNVGFNIRGENNIDIGNENLMLSNTFSGTLSSTRYCALIVGGLVNINVGQTYRLQTVNNLSKLTVNF